MAPSSPVNLRRNDSVASSPITSVPTLKTAELKEAKAGRAAETGAHAVVAGTERARRDSVEVRNFMVDLVAVLQVMEKKFL